MGLGVLWNAAVSGEDDRAANQIGLDAIERGDVVPHEQVVSVLERIIEHCRARVALT